MSNANSEDENSGKDHWLVRPASISLLWRIFIAILFATVIAQYFFPVHGYFFVDEAFGFHAMFGFLSCLAMVVVAKLLGLLLKRKATFYDES